MEIQTTGNGRRRITTVSCGLFASAQKDHVPEVTFQRFLKRAQSLKTRNTLPEDLMLVVRTLEARYKSSVLQSCVEGLYVYLPFNRVHLLTESIFDFGV